MYVAFVVVMTLFTSAAMAQTPDTGQTPVGTATVIHLATPSGDTMRVSDAIRARRSVRSFSDKPIGIGQLSQLLLSADGITGQRRDNDLRAAPSAGALYPIDLYIAVTRVTSLDPGLYRFRVADSSLELIRGGDFSVDLSRAANGQESLQDAGIIVVLIASYERTAQRYGDWAERFVDIEAGAICENIYLQATALGLGTCAIGAFDPAAAKSVLGLSGVASKVVLLLPVGVPN
jgi:SagB-type dehydrogenase family enzyme